MKAVILAAGQGIRMKPLTDTMPKPLIHVCGKPFLYYIIKNIQKAGIKEIGIVAGYKEELIREFIIKNKIKAEVIVQHERKGTGHALSVAEDFCGKDDILVVNGDDLYNPADIEEMSKQEGNVIAGLKHEHPEKYGVLLEEKGILKKIIEKPTEFVGNLVNIGLYKFTNEIFNALKKIKLSPRNELEITDAVTILAQTGKVKVHQMKGFWIPMGYPWEVLNVNKAILDSLDEKVEGIVEPNVTIKGKLILGKNSVIKSGSYIEGPVYIGENCEIGPNAYLRAYTSLSDNTKVGASCEVKNSVVMSGSKIPHHNYVGDSVIGFNCNLGAGTKIANLRYDHKNIKCAGVDTGLVKLGVIMADNVQTGVNSSLMPGIKLSSGTLIFPNAVVFKDTEINGIVK